MCVYRLPSFGLWPHYVHMPKREPLDPIWIKAGMLLAPGPEECQTMLADLCAVFGSVRHTGLVLGVPLLTLNRWIDGTRVPSMAGRRTVWLFWCLVCHPERCQTLHDVQTWGRFRTLQSQPPRPPDRSFSLIAEPGPDDWSI